VKNLLIVLKRTIVIYSRTIFNVTVPDGRLDDTQTVNVEIFDISPDLGADTDSVSVDHIDSISIAASSQ
jgi:hypothetical protein